MLYENYQKKLKRIATGISIVVKTIPIILIAIAVLTVIAASLVVAKGSVGSVSCPDELVYGEELECKAFGMLSRVAFEYRKVGSDEWTTEVPREQGEYEVRAVGNTSFGGKRYGDSKTVTIHPKQIEVSVLEDSIVYGEQPAPSADILEDETIVCESFTFADVTAVKTDITPNSSSVKIITADGKDVTDSYAIVTVARSVDILARPVSITVEDYTAIYNGKECSFDKFEISDGSLKDGDILNARFSDKLIEVGNVENKPSFRVLNADGSDVTHLYAFSIRVGQLTVDKRPLIITTSGFEKTYTGDVQYLSEYVASEQTPLVEGHKIVTAGYSKFTDAGEYTNAMAFKVLDARGADVSNNYALTVIEGTVKINPKKIVVTAPSGTWVYDGLPHYNAGGLVSEGVIDGHRVVVTGAIPFLTDVGKVENTFKVEVIRSDIAVEDIYGESNDIAIEDIYGESMDTASARGVFVPDGEVLDAIKLTSNYEIEFVPGTIQVTKRTVTVKPEDVKEVYDGLPLAPTSVVLANSSVNTLTEGCSVSARITGSQLDVGSESSEIVANTVKIVLNRGTDGERDVTHNYDIKTERGSITVIIRELVLKTQSQEFMYDGKSHDSLKLEDGFTPNLAEGDVLTIVSGPSVTNVAEGQVINEFSAITITNGDQDRYSNYKITYDSGLISVYPRSITIETETNEQAVYNGKKQYFSSVEILGDGLAEGQIISVAKSTEFEDAMERSAINEVLDFKIYFENDSTQTDVKAGNYEWSFDFGYVRINKRVVKISAEGHEWSYDGEAHSWINDAEGNSTVSVDNLAKNHYFAVVDYPLVTDYRDVALENKVEIRIYTDVEGNPVDKTSNYEISDQSEYGRLVINKIPITITTQGKTWTYDGSEHFYINSVESPSVVQVVGLLTTENHNHEYSIARYPIIKNVDDSCANKVEIKIFETVDGKKVDKTHNYYVSVDSQYGALVIEKRVIKIRTQKVLDAIYNGEIQQFMGFELLGDYGDRSLAQDQIFEVRRTTSFEDVMFGADGVKVLSADNEILEFVIYCNGDPDKNDVSENYTVEWDKQQVRINPRVVNISTRDAIWIYDGKEHSCRTDETILSVENLASGHSFKIGTCPAVQNYTATPIENRVTVKIYKLDEGGNEINKTQNYIFAESFGTLAVEKRNIIIVTETNRDTIYDGKAHVFTNPENIFLMVDGRVIHDVGGLSDNHRFVVKESTSIRYVTDGVLDNVYYDYEMVDAAGNSVKGNYDIVEWQYGKIELQKRPVVIKTGSLTHTYNAENVSCTAWEYGKNNKYKFVGGDDFAVVKSTTAKDVNRISVNDPVGSYDNLFEEYTVTDAAGIDRAGNYDITFDESCGKITVNPRPITVTSLDAKEEFDGDYLTRDNYDITKGTLAKNYHTVVMKFVRNAFYAGKYDNLYEIVIMDGETDITKNYEITKKYGTLEVTPVPITLSIVKVSALYDGQPHYVNLNCSGQRADVTVTNAWLDCFITNSGSISVDEVQRRVGDISCTVTKNVDGRIVSVPEGSYEISFRTFGTLAVVISRRTIIVKANDADKVYDGTPLENKGYFVSGSGLAEGHVMEVVFSESSTAMGNDKDVVTVENKIQMVIIKKLLDSGEWEELSHTEYNNYSITLVSGELTVYPNDKYLQIEGNG